MKSAQATCAGAQLQSGAAAARYSFQRRALRISHNSHKHISIPARAKARHLTMAFAHPLTTKLEGKSWSDVRDLLRSPELEGQVRYRQSELHPDLYCLTYEQISADWKNPFTSECRGQYLLVMCPNICHQYCSGLRESQASSWRKTQIRLSAIPSANFTTLGIFMLLR